VFSRKLALKIIGTRAAERTLFEREVPPVPHPEIKGHFYQEAGKSVWEDEF